MMARRVSLVCAALALPLLLACGGGGQGQREDLAAKAAQAFYGHLAAGRFDDYAKGMAGVDGLPPAYRSQVLDAARQLMAVQLTAHGGIDSVGVAGESIEESGGRAVALLTLCFHDGIREEVAVPMVEVDGEWKMR